MEGEDRVPLFVCRLVFFGSSQLDVVGGRRAESMPCGLRRPR